MEILGIITVILIAMFINGVIAEVEDNSPGGGFNNSGDKWKDSFKNPTKLQVFVWSLGILAIGVLSYAALF